MYMLEKREQLCYPVRCVVLLSLCRKHLSTVTCYLSLTGTQDQLCKTVAHLSRIIRAWANLLNKPGKLRRKPRLACGGRGEEGGEGRRWERRGGRGGERRGGKGRTQEMETEKEELYWEEIEVH